jgi:hypothetical protein
VPRTLQIFGDGATDESRGSGNGNVHSSSLCIESHGSLHGKGTHVHRTREKMVSE